MKPLFFSGLYTKARELLHSYKLGFLNLYNRYFGGYLVLKDMFEVDPNFFINWG